VRVTPPKPFPKTAFLGWELVKPKPLACLSQQRKAARKSKGDRDLVAFGFQRRHPWLEHGPGREIAVRQKNSRPA
ncbi:MAG TPA: hypothetical protein PLJ27_14845, partial [Polyangiaceae bacterium]|nr:hypothetical protein [Polyangiaceae bacterium]HQK18733.1 hypothetical protein [Polyangiaceae bacterium]